MARQLPWQRTVGCIVTNAMETCRPSRQTIIQDANKNQLE